MGANGSNFNRSLDLSHADELQPYLYHGLTEKTECLTCAGKLHLNLTCCVSNVTTLRELKICESNTQEGEKCTVTGTRYDYSKSFVGLYSQRTLQPGQKTTLWCVAYYSGQVVHGSKIVITTRLQAGK